MNPTMFFLRTAIRFHLQACGKDLPSWWKETMVLNQDVQILTRVPFAMEPDVIRALGTDNWRFILVGSSLGLLAEGSRPDGYYSGNDV
jgi:hypothetical protein